MTFVIATSLVGAAIIASGRSAEDASPG
jgi:hypothetical protein